MSPFTGWPLTGFGQPGHLLGIDRGDAGSAIGEDRLMNSDILFDARSKVRAGSRSRRTFATRTLPWLRREVRASLELGARCGSSKTAATCREILEVEPSLWTFARAEDVEPTNDAAERALRHPVCWRKTSFGTDSASGSRFVERRLTAVESCRRLETFQASSESRSSG
jgi:transposase